MKHLFRLHDKIVVFFGDIFMPNKRITSYNKA